MARNYLIGLVLMLSCSWSMAADVLRVGMSADYPPLAFKQEGQIVGIEADNARAVGEIIGRRIQLVDMLFEKLIPALLAREIDIIMSGMSVTAQRSAQVSFTDSYMLVGQMAILHKDKLARF
ncbi:MAG: transporter substrate-binding domain-containing protein, partial [Halieaceae bacterium]|nr:transporter substrate-binding domain-containing protein [Halieaceae bacterium]